MYIAFYLQNFLLRFHKFFHLFFRATLILANNLLPAQFPFPLLQKKWCTTLLTLTFWHSFLQGYILANTSLKLIFSEKASKFEKIFHIFFTLAKYGRGFFFVFCGLLRKHKLYRVDFACLLNFLFRNYEKLSGKLMHCTIDLNNLTNFSDFFFRATLILANTYIVTRNTCSTSFSGFTKKMGNEIFSWNWCISLLTSILWQYFLFTEWPLPNTCSTSFPAFLKIFFGKLMQRTSTIWLFFCWFVLIYYFLFFRATLIHCNRVAFANTCSISFSGLTKILFKLVLQKIGKSIAACY